MTHVVNRRTESVIGTPRIQIFPVRTPTLPPATHTNVYLLEGKDGFSVVDPASPYPDEQTALDEALAEIPIVEIVLTHHHIDHLSGSFSGVMGLPLYETAQLLRHFGHPV